MGGFLAGLRRGTRSLAGSAALLREEDRENKRSRLAEDIGRLNMEGEKQRQKYAVTEEERKQSEEERTQGEEAYTWTERHRLDSLRKALEDATGKIADQMDDPVAAEATRSIGRTPEFSQEVARALAVYSTLEGQQSLERRARTSADASITRAEIAAQSKLDAAKLKPAAQTEDQKTRQRIEDIKTYGQDVGSAVKRVEDKANEGKPIKVSDALMNMLAQNRGMLASADLNPEAARKSAERDYAASGPISDMPAPAKASQRREMLDEWLDNHFDDEDVIAAVRSTPLFVYLLSAPAKSFSDLISQVEDDPGLFETWTHEDIED